MKTPNKTLLTAVATALLIASPAFAVPIVFLGSDPGANSTDPRPQSDAAAAAYDAASGPTGLITLESAPVGFFSSLMVAPGVTITGSDVNGRNQEIRNTPFGAPDSLFGYNTTAGGSNFASLFGGTLTFSFATPIDTFGAYFSGIQSPAFGTSVTLTFDDGTSQELFFDPVGTIGGVQFLGFTDAGASISSITLNAFNDIIGVDDIRYGPTASVPENGGTAVFLGLGLIGVLVLRRSTRRLPHLT